MVFPFTVTLTIVDFRSEQLDDEGKIKGMVRKHRVIPSLLYIRSPIDPPGALMCWPSCIRSGNIAAVYSIINVFNH